MLKYERFNYISHMVGALLAVIGMVVLIVYTARFGSPRMIVSACVYGTSLFLLYLFSTLAHSTKGRAKRILIKFDYCAIYILIAGTYTPFTLVSLKGGWGWSIFGVAWGLALFGIILDTLIRQKKRIIPIVLYIVMGWLSVIPHKPLYAALGFGGFFYLALGGIFYTSGVYFYLNDKKKPYYHGIWHLFVIAGSVSHYFGIAKYVYGM